MTFRGASNFVHHRQFAVSARTDHEPTAFPGDVLLYRKRRVSEIVAKAFAGRFPAFANLPSVDQDIVVIGVAVNRERAKRKIGERLRWGTRSSGVLEHVARELRPALLNLLAAAMRADDVRFLVVSENEFEFLQKGFLARTAVVIVVGHTDLSTFYQHCRLRLKVSSTTRTEQKKSGREPALWLAALGEERFGFAIQLEGSPLPYERRLLVRAYVILEKTPCALNT